MQTYRVCAELREPLVFASDVHTRIEALRGRRQIKSSGLHIHIISWQEVMYQKVYYEPNRIKDAVCVARDVMRCHERMLI
jgi:hypothetical protein